MALGFAMWCFHDGYMVDYRIEDNKFVKPSAMEVDASGEVDGVPVEIDVEVKEPKALYKHYSSDFWGEKGINLVTFYMFNVVGTWVFLIVGVLLIVLGRSKLKRSVTVDDEGLAINGGAKVLWSSVTGLDASQLETKAGLLLLTRDEGEPVALCRFYYEDFRGLVAFTEDHVSSGE